MCRSLAVSVLCVAIAGCQTNSDPVVRDLNTGSNSFSTRVYAGASYGQSWLDVGASDEQSGTGSQNAGGTQLRLGLDLHNRLALEFDTATFGVTEFREAFIDDKYSSSAVSALIYGLNGVSMRSRREGLSAYARFGYGTLNNAAVVDQLKFDDALPIFGLGAEYGLSNGLGVRAELTRYDRDALLTGIGIVYRFGTSSHSTAFVERQLEPELAAAQPPQVVTEELIEDTSVLTPERLLVQEQQQLLQHTLADRWRPVARPDDKDSDGVVDGRDECPSTQSSVTVGSNGCGLFDGNLSEVTFSTGSHLLSAPARAQLNRVAQTLLAFPEARIQVRAHTDSIGDSDKNLAHSVRRAEAVVLYLQSRGVNPLQLQAKGMGELFPIATNDTADGRLKNRRVQLLTLPDRDAQNSNTDVVAEVTSATVESDEVITPTVKAVAEISVGHPRDQLEKLASPEKEPELQSAELKVESNSAVTVEQTSSQQIAKKQGPLKLKVTPLPVPGYVPGLNLSGVIQGVEFQSGTAELSDEGRAALQPVLVKLLANPEVSIAIMSHTDDVGDEAENVNLSLKRSGAVLSFLAQGGVEPSRLQAEGYGESLPLVQNVTAEDRARNRRVEIRVLPLSSD